MESLDARVSNMEKTIKKLVNQNCNILKIVADNFNTLLNKMEQAKGHDSSIVISNQGLSKRTRDHSKKSD